MSSLDRVVRAGFGVGAALGAAVILSACTGRQNSQDGGQATTTTTGTSAAPVATVVATTAQAAKPAPATKAAQPAANGPAGACASATKAGLEAALKADKQLSGALLVDSKGLQRIKCAAPWAFAHFSNTIDGGSVLFAFRNGSWIAQNGGTGELCEKVPAAIAEKICG